MHTPKVTELNTQQGFLIDSYLGMEQGLRLIDGEIHVVKYGTDYKEPLVLFLLSASLEQGLLYEGNYHIVDPERERIVYDTNNLPRLLPKAFESFEQFKSALLKDDNMTSYCDILVAHNRAKPVLTEYPLYDKDIVEVRPKALQWFDTDRNVIAFIISSGVVSALISIFTQSMFWMAPLVIMAIVVFAGIIIDKKETRVMSTPNTRVLKAIYLDDTGTPRFGYDFIDVAASSTKYYVLSKPRELTPIGSISDPAKRQALENYAENNRLSDAALAQTIDTISAIKQYEYQLAVQDAEAELYTNAGKIGSQNPLHASLQLEREKLEQDINASNDALVSLTQQNQAIVSQHKEQYHILYTEDNP